MEPAWLRDKRNATSGDDVAVRPERVPGEKHADRIGRLFRENNEALIRFLRKRLRSDQEAQEVAQEAYVRLLGLQSPEQVSFLRAFLYKTAANLAIDHLRSRARHVERCRQVALFEELREVPGPEREARGQEELARLSTLIDQLPPKCRRSFLLLRVHGLEYAEIAQRMSISERMVRVYVVRALVHCRQGLEQIHLAKDLLE